LFRFSVFSISNSERVLPCKTFPFASILHNRVKKYLSHISLLIQYLKWMHMGEVLSVHLSALFIPETAEWILMNCDVEDLKKHLLGQCNFVLYWYSIILTCHEAQTKLIDFL
jgi:hypothetical protein